MNVTDAPTTAIYTLSLHDALPIYQGAYVRMPFAELLDVTAEESAAQRCIVIGEDLGTVPRGFRDRKSTRLNSSHVEISYAVFCLKKKNRWHASGPAPACPTSSWLT